MALSPNYGFPEPDNSSLVKNGAQDIRALGDAVDTAVWNVGYGQAGKNKIINGDFTINQRNFSSTTTSGAYGHDRFWLFTAGNTTYSNQTFTAGAAPVAGYEAKNFARLVTTSQNATTAYSMISQKIESVRTAAGQTATISFWAKAATGTPKIAGEISQNFGTGGSPSATVNTAISAVTLGTSWARYSMTIAVPSISGKTLGTNGDDSLILYLWVSAGTDFNSRASSIGAQNNTFDIWGVQVEYGSKATPFQTASGGSIQGELAMCQRYYARYTVGNTFGFLPVSGYAVNTTTAYSDCRFIVPMRTAPSAVEYGGSIRLVSTLDVGVAMTSYTLGGAGIYGNGGGMNTAGSLIAGGTYKMQANNDAAAYVGFTAEL
jgi:hypothetical protein